ncbi:hypothetical protein EV421DRAFT_1835076, partial [Armillaria borealis]
MCYEIRRRIQSRQRTHLAAIVCLRSVVVVFMVTVFAKVGLFEQNACKRYELGDCRPETSVPSRRSSVCFICISVFVAACSGLQASRVLYAGERVCRLYREYSVVPDAEETGRVPCYAFGRQPYEQFDDHYSSCLSLREKRLLSFALMESVWGAPGAGDSKLELERRT